MIRASAEAIALHALAYVVSTEDLVLAFFAATGASPSDLRERAEEPEFLRGVLDFLLQEDARVLGFAEATGHVPALVQEAYASLPGGQTPHWT